MVYLVGVLRSVALAASLLLAGGCTSESVAVEPKPTHANHSPPPAAASTAHSAAPAAPRPSRLTYFTVNTAHADPTKPLPWVVALHGLGDRPQAFARLFEDFPSEAHVYCVQAPMKFGPGFDWFGVRASGDPKKLSKAIRRATTRVVELIAALQIMPQNQGKPVVTGFSQGGMLSFSLATLSGTAIRESLPIGGWLPPPLWPTTASPKTAPIRAFHGETDRVVPWLPTRAAVHHLQSMGFAATARSYPNLGHSMSAALRRDWFKALESALPPIP